jgi:hypothetical protein
MTINQQAEVARVMTGSTLSDAQIVNGVRSTNKAVKNKASQEVENFAKTLTQPFDQTYPTFKTDMAKIASKYNLDSAILFWIYMEWIDANK